MPIDLVMCGAHTQHLHPCRRREIFSAPLYDLGTYTAISCDGSLATTVRRQQY